MGFFDDMGSKNKSPKEVEDLNDKVITTFSEFHKAYKKLERNRNYASQLRKIKEDTIQFTIDYFKSKGFDITKTSSPNTIGVTAKTDEIKVELLFESDTSLNFSIPGTYADSLIVEDKNHGPNKFQGRVIGDKVHFENKKLGNEYQNLLDALNQIEEDLRLVEEKINTNYTPDLYFYSKEETENFSDIKDYLDYISEKLNK